MARLLDSSLEPNRIRVLNGAALAGLPGEAHGGLPVAVSVGSVEAAVRAEMAEIDVLARGAGATGATEIEDFWSAYGAMTLAAGRALTLHVVSVPSRLVATVRAVEKALGPEPAALAGCAALGTLDVMLPAPPTPEATRIVDRMRQGVAALGGHVIVRRAPVDVRRAIDPWGPVDPSVMTLMKGLRDEFDPRRVLNPGRFVGRL